MFSNKQPDLPVNLRYCQPLEPRWRARQSRILRFWVRLMVCSAKKDRALAVPPRAPMRCPGSSTPQVFAMLAAMRLVDHGNLVYRRQCFALRHL